MLENFSVKLSYILNICSFNKLPKEWSSQLCRPFLDKAHLSQGCSTEPWQVIGWGVEFSQFLQNRGMGVGGVQIFSHNKGRVGKIEGVVLKKGVSLLFILPKLFQCYLSLSVWLSVCVYVFRLFTSFYQYSLCFVGRTLSYLI